MSYCKFRLVYDLASVCASAIFCSIDIKKQHYYSLGHTGRLITGGYVSFPIGPIRCDANREYTGRSNLPPTVTISDRSTVKLTQEAMA